MSGALIVPSLIGGALIIPSAGSGGPPGAPGAAGAPGGNAMALGLALAIATTALASGTAATYNQFRTDGYTATADGGEAWYYRKAVIEADAPGDLVSSDAVRLGLNRTQALSLEMFGGRCNAPGTPAATANDAAVEAIKHFDEMMGEASWEIAAATVNLWKGKYYFADVNGHDLKNTRTWKAHGGGCAVAGGILGTWLIGPPNWKAFRPQAYNTTADTVEAPYTTDSAGSMFENIQFMGNNGAAPSPGDITAGYALHPRTPITAFNCRFIFFWDGTYNNAAAGIGGASEGQASHCYYHLCSFERNANFGSRNAPAPDNNISEYAHCNFIGNGRGGLELGDFLGSYVHGGHFRDNGNQSVRFGVSSVTSFGGSVYYVNQTATMATTDAALRVGNPTTNSLWTRLGPGGPSSYYPDYTTWAGTYQKGGPIIADRTTAARHVAVAYYTENGQPPCMWNTSCFIAPMLSGAGDVGFGTGIIDGRVIQNAAGSAYNKLSDTAATSISTARTFAIHNNQPTSGFTIWSTLSLEQGFKADGVTERQIARLRASASTADPVNSYGIVYIGTKNYGAETTTDWWQFSDGPLRAGPVSDNVVQLGAGAERLKEIFCANNVINTSDQREKAYIQALRDKLLDVADEIELCQFKFKDAVAAKGKDKARWHFGVVAQQVEQACNKHGIDGFELGFLCFDKWDEVRHPVTKTVPVYEDQLKSVPKRTKGGRVHFVRTIEQVKVGEREEPVLDKDGAQKLKLVRKAGDRYGVRYDQLIILKLAAQDRRHQLLEARVAKLETLLA